MLFCITASGTGAQHRIPASTSVQSGLVKLPVIDKQDIRFTQLSVGGESLQSRIQSITQDNYGFLWLGTNAGLYRYDGYALKSYRHDPNNPNSLSDDTISVVYRDRDGILWIGTGLGGLDRLDPTEGTFKHYRHDPADDRSLSDDGVFCIYQDRSGILWVGTRGGLDRLDPGTGTFVQYHPQYTTSIFEDRLGNLWIGILTATLTGPRGVLDKMDRTTGRSSRFQHDPANPHSLAGNNVRSTLEDPSGRLWVGAMAGSGLSALDVKTGQFTRYSFHPEEPGSQSLSGVKNLYEDREGVLWLCTLDRRWLKLDRERKQFIRYSNDLANPNSLPHDTVLTLFEDAEGTMWRAATAVAERHRGGATRCDLATAVAFRRQFEPPRPQPVAAACPS